MSFLLDPIEEGINSLLDPLTSVPATTTADDTSPVETSVANDRDTTSIARATSASARASTSNVAESTSRESTPTTDTDSTTSRSSRTATSTSDESTSLSFPSLTGTTLSTSTTASSSRPPPAPPAGAEATAPPTQAANNDASEPSSGSGLSTAGIVVAAVFGVVLFISIIWLTIRFCPPVRRRLDAWYQRRRDERTYREALDGPAAEKGSLSSSRGSTSASDASRPLSFFALGKNPQLQTQNLPSHSSRGMLHEQYVSPNSADTPTRGHGLGLGRVSLLRNTSLLRKAGFEAPPSLPQAGPQQAQFHQQAIAPYPPVQDHIPGPNSATRFYVAQPTPTSSTSLKPTHSQIQRKPLPAEPPLAYSHPHPHPGYDDRSAPAPARQEYQSFAAHASVSNNNNNNNGINRQPNSNPHFNLNPGLAPDTSPNRRFSHEAPEFISLAKNSPPPHLHQQPSQSQLQLQIPANVAVASAHGGSHARQMEDGDEIETGRVSQIGLAVSGSPTVVDIKPTRSA